MHETLGQESEVQMGILWVLFLQGLASAIVQILLRWWFQSASNRTAMLTMQTDLTK